MDNEYLEYIKTLDEIVIRENLFKFLYYTIKKNHINSFKYLYEYAEPYSDYLNSKVVENASLLNRVEIVNYLLTHGNNHQEYLYEALLKEVVARDLVEIYHEYNMIFKPKIDMYEMFKSAMMNFSMRMIKYLKYLYPNVDLNKVKGSVIYEMIVEKRNDALIERINEYNY